MKTLEVRDNNSVFLGIDGEANFVTDESNKHVLISGNKAMGTTGPVVSTLLNYKNSLITFDIAGELFKKTAGHRSEFNKINLYDPFNTVLEEVNKIAINPLLDAGLGKRAIEYCEVIANSMKSAYFPQPSDLEKGYTHWGEKLMTGLLVYIIHCEEKAHINLPRCYHYMRQGCDKENNKFIGEILSQSVIAIDKKLTEAENFSTNTTKEELKEVEEYLRGLGNEFCALDEKTAAGSLSYLFRSLAFLRNKEISASLRENAVSLRQILNTKAPQTLYLAIPKNDVAIAQPLFGCFTQLAAKVLVEEEGFGKNYQNIMFFIAGYAKIWSIKIHSE